MSDVHKAVTNVLRLLAREMKPLGMEGVATFDPLSGLFLWREHRRFAAARKRATRELYREDVDDEFGARGRGRDEDEEAAEGDILAFEDHETRRFGDASTSYASTSNEKSKHLETHPEKLREKRFVASTLPSLKLGARHAAAAYGSLAALLENNSARDKAHGLVGAVRDAIVAGGDGDAAEKRATEAAARSARVSVADIVAADWVTLPFSPASYVCVDRKGATVVLAIRGTVSTGDLLTDAVSTSTPFLGGWAHSGMVMSAYQVCKTQLPAAAAALVNNPGFAFLVTGHSMGAGVAAILAMLVHSGDADVLAAAEKAAKEAEAKMARSTEGGGGGDDLGERTEVDGSPRLGLADGAMAAVRDVRCHCFAAPSVCSLDLSLKARKHTVSVVAGKDVIPRLCYAAVRRLLRRLNAAAPSQPVMKAISAALGGRDKEKKSDDGFNDARESEASESESRLFGEEPAPETTPANTNTRSLGGEKPKTKDPSQEREKEKRCQGEWDDVSGERGLELRDHFASDFLVQPGFVIHLRHLTSDAGPTAEARHPTAFTEIPISTRMMADHVPMVYQSAIEAVVARNEEEAKRAAAEAAAFEEETARYGPGGLHAYRRGLEALKRAKKTRDAERRRRRRRRRRDEAALRRALEEAEAARDTRSRLGRDAAGLAAGPGPGPGPADALASSSPGERLWANVRRVVGVGHAGELKLGGVSKNGADGGVFEIAESRKPRDEGDETVSSSETDDASRENGASRSDSDSDSDVSVSDPSIGSGSRSTSPRNAEKDAEKDEDAWSEDEEADLLAAVAEMLGLDVSDPMPEERERRRSPVEPPEAPAHRRQNSWGLGRLGRLVGKLKRDADAMFTGGEAFETVEGADEASGFEVDGYVAQARATQKG